MISPSDYFGPYSEHPDLTQPRKDNAYALLERVNNLLVLAEANGVELHNNPRTATMVAGDANGGFRPQDCKIGALHSNHKEGRAVDIFDPHGDLDRWLTDGRLTSAGLYRESPTATEGWCHLSDLPPHSGKRTFQP